MFDFQAPDLSAANHAYEDRQKMVRAAEIAKDNSAEIISKRLYDSIISYQQLLPDESDVALQLVQFGTNMTIFVESIAHIGSNLIVFYGKDSLGKPMELIQHIHQLNFLMVVAPKPSVEAPKRRIGFVGEWQ